MNITINNIYKISASLFLGLILILLYNYLFSSNSEDRANEVVVRQSLVDITKTISINQDTSGNYGISSLPLPFAGCNLPKTFLDDIGIQNIFKKLQNLTGENVKCISDGNNNEIRSWAISAKLGTGNYWCVDEGGDRRIISNPITKTSCK